MKSSNSSLLIKLFVLIAIFSIVACNKSRDTKRNTLTKKGIVLKCQGNPVSCYGKRSSLPEEESILEQPIELESNLDLYNEEKLESNFEKLLETLISNCKSGDTKSCNTMLKIMLLNSK